MDDQLARDIIYTFDKSAFSQFVFDLWTHRDSQSTFDESKTYYRPEIGRNIIENYTREYLEQYYKLIIPFYYPYEVFKTPHLLLDKDIIKSLSVYKELEDKRYGSWFFPTDGQYYMPTITFFTNYFGLEKQVYEDLIIESFSKIVNEKIELDAEIAVGSIDSFLDLENKATKNVLSDFLQRNRSGLVISFDEDKINVNPFISEKYLTGTLKNSLNLCEPVILAPNKNEIIKEFEYLLNTHKYESELESFLVKYYKDIFGERYDKVESQIWLKFPEYDINNKERRLDIFLRNSIEKDWELFELKREFDLTRTYRDIITFKSEISLAIQQIHNYKRILNQDSVKKELTKQDIDYCTPEYRLVIGPKPDIPNDQWRFLKTTNERDDFKIMTYEDILTEMKIRISILNQSTNRR